MKQWIRVSRAALGPVVVTVTVQENNLSAKWSIKTTRSEIRSSVMTARSHAIEALRELQAIVAEMERAA